MANRLVMGPLPGGGFGIRVSRPGANVLDPDLPGNQVAFDSRWLEGSQIIISDSITLGSGGGWQYFNYGSTLGYIPRAFALYQITSGALSGRWRPFGQDQSYTDGPGSDATGWDYDGTDQPLSTHGMVIENNRVGFWRTGSPVVYAVLRG